MSGRITRRDFAQATLLGTGAVLLDMQAPIAFADEVVQARVGPDWYGYGGVGDYAASHGNTPDLVNAAHSIRDDQQADDPADTIDTGEEYDLVIVGAGMAGLGAAYEYSKRAQSGSRCLIIDNHPVFGGESKRNEFDVDGDWLIGPQGANGFSVPNTREDRESYKDIPDLRYMRELGIPLDFDYGVPQQANGRIRLARDNYGYQYWQEEITSVAHYFRGTGPQGNWVLDPIVNAYRDLPGSEASSRDLFRWRAHEFETPSALDDERWLDTMTYKQFLEDELELAPEVTRWADRIVTGSAGFGCDVISAYGAMRLGLPVRGERREYDSWTRHSFPGGNDGFSRYFVKKFMPRAIRGTDDFDGIMNGGIDFAALDQPGEAMRMRLGATVNRVRHDGPPETAGHVIVSYIQNGTHHRLKAKRVVMACGGWINKYVVHDLPDQHRTAYESFVHAPFLVANVAVRNWRFVERLGTGACMWSDGEFGNSCNIRLPMHTGSYRPQIHPDRPALLTFYVPFYYPGEPAAAQGIAGRWELFSTSYAEFERRIQLQMNELFAATGFDWQSDVAGIVLNRWGHAYMTPQPGFFFSRDSQPTAAEIVARPFGRIAIAHSELEGIQHWGPAADRGKRAIEALFS